MEDWTVTVTEPLPNCTSILLEAWERLVTLTKWHEWRSESPMRGKNVATTVVPPAKEPLQAGDEYIVMVPPVLKIYCRVLESSSDSNNEGASMVFDSMGRALCGLVTARFRYTIFQAEDGVVTAKAQEMISSLPFLVPPKETLEKEHRHTFKELNASFSMPS